MKNELQNAFLKSEIDKLKHIENNLRNECIVYKHEFKQLGIEPNEALTSYLKTQNEQISKFEQIARNSVRALEILLKDQS